MESILGDEQMGRERDMEDVSSGHSDEIVGIDSKKIRMEDSSTSRGVSSGKTLPLKDDVTPVNAADSASSGLPSDSEKLGQ